MSTQTWPPSLTQSWRTQLTDMRTQLTYVTQHRDRIAALAAEIQAALPEATLRITSSLDVLLTGSREQLRALMRVLRRHGLSPYTRPNEQTSYSTWFSPGGQLGQAWKVWVSFSSTVCRRVQVGTRMEEVPVYEVHCD